MWRLYVLASTCRQRPSALAGVEDEWAAYQFDQACLYFGRWVENRLSEIDKLTKKPRHTLDELLESGIAGRKGAQHRGRSARHLVRKRVKIGPSGIW